MIMKKENNQNITEEQKQSANQKKEQNQKDTETTNTLENHKEEVESREESGEAEDLQYQGQGEENLEKKIEDLENQNERLEEEKQSYLQQLKRLQADFDNYKKRTAKEWERTSTEKAKELAEDILPILDNFERALNNIDDEKVDPNFYEGVNMIYDQLYEVLTKNGLERIEAEGQEFDPNYHEAVMQVDSEEHESNVVIEEIQPGFLFKDRLLRASVVKVSR
ncbi:GrpE protein [Natranaerobius thermophilus JW/NM-WN-LF]|uniref:Protein GrpE n=2 Tax=Natranaerobius TaxID=375928 RepID=B2A1M8_NATTJ|nr:GrpE protein [Natranaerobius thermophilus JW/NM-WN-LF]